MILSQLSDKIGHTWQQFEKLKNRQNWQIEFPFKFDDEGHTIASQDETKAIPNTGGDSALKQASDRKSRKDDEKNEEKV